MVGVVRNGCAGEKILLRLLCVVCGVSGASGGEIDD